MQSPTMQPPGAAMAEPMAQPMPNEPQGETATPEEQDQYDLLMKFTSIMLHHEQTQPAYLKFLKDGQSVPEAVGRVVAIIARQFEVQSKTQLSDAVQSEALPDVLEDVFELAVMAGLIDDAAIDQAAIELATKTAVRNYTNQGLITGQLNESNLNQKLEQLKTTPDGAKAYEQMQAQQQGNAQAPMSPQQPPQQEPV